VLFRNGRPWKLPLVWAANNEVRPGGNAFGYTSASVNLRDALARRGDVQLLSTDPALRALEIADRPVHPLVVDRRPPDGSPAALDHEANHPIAVHLCHPFEFRPENFPDCRNVLFTMYEFDPPPPEFPSAFGVADFILTPSEYSRRVLLAAARSKHKTIAVSGLGYDLGLFPYADRFVECERQGWSWGESNKLRVLWVGAPTERKGYDLTLAAWEPLINHPWCELYMKTTLPDDDPRERRCFTRWNITYDERTMSRADLWGLYASAHVFLFPSRGEGFGLTALEAAATGLPVITVAGSGQQDFLAGSGSCVFIDPQPAKMHTMGGYTTYGLRAQPADIGRALLGVVGNYRAYLKAARRHAHAIASSMTWDHAAGRLLQALTTTG
jgi:glycosyltransferase involved in cell wall biosynthesis